MNFRTVQLLFGFCCFSIAIILFYKDTTLVQRIDEVIEATEETDNAEAEVAANIQPVDTTEVPRTMREKASSDSVMKTSALLMQKKFLVQTGDHLARFLGRHLDNSVVIQNLVGDFQKRKWHRKLKVGQPFYFTYEKKGGKDVLKRITFYPSKNHKAIFFINSDASELKIEDLPKEWQRFEGNIKTSLYEDAAKLGIPAQAVRQFVGLVSHNVDFQRSIRTGDRFEIIVPMYFDEDTEIGFVDDIVYGALNLKDGEIDIYRFTNEDGKIEYYNGRGDGTCKALLKTPVPGAPISSRYGKRKHPVLGYSQMHRGIDFSAMTGTPIYAAGDGVVERADRYGSYGNYVRIRHDKEYATAYAHLSRFAKGLKAGKRVKQGDVIGNVGATGRVSGAHLHYEVLHHGKQINPGALKMPSKQKLTGNALEAFTTQKAIVDKQRAR